MPRWKSKIALFALGVVLALFALAIFADFIANDKPLIMTYQGRLYLPILKDYSVRLRLSKWETEFLNIQFKDFVVEHAKDVGFAVFPPIRYSPTEIELTAPTTPPSGKHLLGTDDIGRDVASRIVHGSRVSLSVGFVAVSIYVGIGILLGSLAGFYGGVVDIIVSRLIEIMLTIPTFFLIITVVAFLPQSIFNIMVVIGLTSWPTVARLTRGEFLKAKSLEYVVAARALGARDFRTIFRHVLPNTLAPVFVAATFGVASAILIESTLASWGLVSRPRRPAGARSCRVPAFQLPSLLVAYRFSRLRHLRNGHCVQPRW